MSKPQIVTQEFGGYHNSDLNATKDRLYKGGSWHKQNVVQLIPTADLIPAKVVLSWMNLGAAPNNGIVRKMMLGMEVGEAYSYAIEEVIKDPGLTNFNYILTIEHDNAPPPDGLIKLLQRMEEHPELACIGGLYFTKYHGGVAQIWGDPRDPQVNYRPQLPDTNGGLVECCGTGMGFNLFRLDMFKDARLRRPWFRTQKERDAKGNFGMATQDLYFWSDARKYGYRCAIDCSVRVGHYDVQNDIMW
jgi:hypothetical protein